MLFGSTYSYFHGSGSHSSFNDGTFWIILTVISAIPTGFETLYQEKAFRLQKAPKFVVLTYYNLFSLVIYFAWIFATMTRKFGTCVTLSDVNCSQVHPCDQHEMWTHQWNAIQCYFGDSSVPCCQQWGATIWTTLFTIGYAGSFSVGAYVLSFRNGSNYVANTNALVYPCTAIILWAKFIAGRYYSTFTWWILIALLFILFGNILYSNTDLKFLERIDKIIVKEKISNGEDQLLLEAQHK